jgi:hypothetical protein
MELAPLLYMSLCDEFEHSKLQARFILIFISQLLNY